VSEFQRLYTGRLWSVLGWDQLTALWQRIDPAAGWYLLASGVDADADGVLAADAATVTDLHRPHRHPCCAMSTASPIAASSMPTISHNPQPDQDLRPEQPRFLLRFLEKSARAGLGHEPRRAQRVAILPSRSGEPEALVAAHARR
jgi:hypothetical protein